jgi:hypothetical protein
MANAPQILPGPFDPAELLALINNEGVRVAIRRYAPQYNAVFVDKNRTVVLVIRAKTMSELSSSAAHERRKNAAYFFATPGMFKCVAELLETIISCSEALSVGPGTSNLESRVVNGKTILVISADRSPTKRLN